MLLEDSPGKVFDHFYLVLLAEMCVKIFEGFGFKLEDSHYIVNPDDDEFVEPVDVAFEARKTLFHHLRV